MNLSFFSSQVSPEPEPFDLEEYEAEILLRLPLSVLQNPKITKVIVEKLLTEKIHELALEKFKDILPKRGPVVDDLD